MRKTLQNRLAKRAIVLVAVVLAINVVSFLAAADGATISPGANSALGLAVVVSAGLFLVELVRVVARRRER